MNNKIFRVAVVDFNFNIDYYLPYFYSTKKGAKEAIERVLNDGYTGEWIKEDWNRHRWQLCSDKQDGDHCIEMVKIVRNRYFYKGFGFITFTLV